MPASEYARITCNYVPVYHEDLLLPMRFTVCRPEEYPLLEIWQHGYGPNTSHGFAVVRQKDFLLVRHSYPRGYQQDCPWAIAHEGTLSQAKFDELIEPLKTMLTGAAFR